MSHVIRDEQVRRNLASRNAWALYTRHRRNVTNLICEAAPAVSCKMCILGAGNCNDLDLPQLVDKSHEIHLVDLDAEALRWGLRQQGLEGRSEFILHGDVDVSGIADFCATWAGREPTTDDLQRCLAALNQCPPLLNEQSFGVVASVCLISQLIDSLVKTLGESHPQFLALMAAVRMQHLRTLSDMTSAGGKVLVVTDFVSSVSYPPLTDCAPAELPKLIAELINQRNFFTGLNPFVLERLFRESSELAPSLNDVQLTRPWLWEFGARTYACCAITARRVR